MGIKYKKGIALLIAVIFASVILAFALAVSSLGYKQEVLSANALTSSQAFYAADAALECTLFDDQTGNDFSFGYGEVDTTALEQSDIICNGETLQGMTPPETVSATTWTNSQAVPYNVISFDVSMNSANDNTTCADITVYKPASGEFGDTTYLFSTGYSATCQQVQAAAQGASGVRISARGLEAYY